MSNETNDTLRDLRKPGFFQIDNEIVRDFELSPHEFAVYAAICYHASANTQQAWPGMTTIAKEMGMSRRKVIDCIKELERLKLIYVKRETKDDGTRKVNHYSLLDVKALIRRGSESDALPSESDALGVVNEVHKNKTHKEQDPPTNGADSFNAFKEEVTRTFNVNGQRAASIALMLLGRSHDFKYAKYDLDPAMHIDELRSFAECYRREHGDGVRLPLDPMKIQDKVIGFRNQVDEQRQREQARANRNEDFVPLEVLGGD